MIIIDWDAMEAEVQAANYRVPPMGAPYRTTRACPAHLGQMWCVKPHNVERDPVHVAAHKNYGVIAVWSAHGGPPQINSRLFERVGLDAMCWLLADPDPAPIVLVKPRENA